MLLLGCAGFALFFLSDLNDSLFRKKYLTPCFPVGAVLLIVSMTVLSIRGEAPAWAPAFRIAAWVLSGLFFALEIYTLFFALSIPKSYASPGSDREAFCGGVYALCRHPGVAWFALMAFCLWPAAGFPVYAAALFSALDIALVVFEDIYVFPRRLKGYDAYRRETPFLIPRGNSIKRCANYYLHNTL